MATTLLTTTQIHFSAVPVTQGHVTEWRTIFFQPIEVEAGDLIEIYTEGQVRNDLGYNVELAQLIEIKASVYGGAEPVEGPIQGPINGWNITPGAHYGRFSKEFKYIAQIAGEFYVCARLRARSTGARSGHILSVQANQGMMYVKITK